MHVVKGRQYSVYMHSPAIRKDGFSIVHDITEMKLIAHVYSTPWIG